MRLDRWFVRDLDADFTLPLGDGAVLRRCPVPPAPIRGLRRRSARPLARRTFVVSYANRCFPTKAVAIWQSLDLGGQRSLIDLYLERAGFTDVEARMLFDGSQGDPLVAVVGDA